MNITLLIEADGPRKCAAFTESLVADLPAHFSAQNVAALHQARLSPIPHSATHVLENISPIRHVRLFCLCFLCRSLCRRRRVLSHGV